MSNAERRVWVCVAVAVLGVLLPIAAGCDPGATITYVNETDRTLKVYTADDREPNVYAAILEPHSTVRAAALTITFEGVVLGRDEEGNLLFKKEITWDELESQGWRIVIAEDMLSPTPTENR